MTQCSFFKSRGDENGAPLGIKAFTDIDAVGLGRVIESESGAQSSYELASFEKS
jgi:hypothetical protein